MNSTPSVSSVRQMTRHDRRSPRGVRILNSSGMGWALTPAIFAPLFEMSTRMQGRPQVPTPAGAAPINVDRAALRFGADSQHGTEILRNPAHSATLDSAGDCEENLPGANPGAK